MDSLDFVEIVMLLEELDVQISEEQIEEIKPYLVAPKEIFVRMESISYDANIIAEKNHALLAVANARQIFAGQSETIEGSMKWRKFKSFKLAMSVFMDYV
jgi:hypothetical protein